MNTNHKHPITKFLSLIIAIYSISLCHCYAQEPAATTLGQQDKYASAVRNFSRYFLRDENTLRRMQIINNFSNIQGEEAQALRLLLWTRLNLSDLREEVILQWLVNSGREAPSADVFDKHMAASFKTKEPKEIDSRLAEYKLAITRLKAQKKNHDKMKIIHGKGSGSAAIDCLVDTAEPLGVNFFSLDLQKREKFYENLPRPEKIIDGDREAYNVYTLLWLLESDETLRNDKLIDYIKIAGMMDRSTSPINTKLWLGRVVPLIKNQSAEQQRLRLARVKKIEEQLNKK